MTGTERAARRPRDEPVRASWDPVTAPTPRRGSPDASGPGAPLPRPSGPPAPRPPAGGPSAGGPGRRPPHGRRRGLAALGVVLAVLTGIVLWRAGADPAPTAGSSDAAAGTTSAAGTDPATDVAPPVVTEAPAGRYAAVSIPSAELPAGGDFPVTGAGTWHVVPGSTPQVGQGRAYTYTVEVEDGITVAEGDDAFGTAVDATLDDPRSWVGSGRIAVRRVDAAALAAGVVPDFRVSLTSRATTRSLCGDGIAYEASCWRSDLGRVAINSARWVRGAVAFEGQLGLYRQYAINHEVGHVFDNRHVPCPADGALAPVMMQQTFGTSNDYLAALTSQNPQGLTIPADGAVCRPNPWPY